MWDSRNLGPFFCPSLYVRGRENELASDNEGHAQSECALSSNAFINASTSKKNAAMVHDDGIVILSLIPNLQIRCRDGLKGGPKVA